MTARTRNFPDKILGKEQFAPVEKFPGKLPTLKELIGRCLTFKDCKTDEIIIMEFHRLVQYDKKKKEAKI